MSPAVGPESPLDRAPAVIPAVSGAGALAPAEKDRVIEWYRSEFAAANAIIDALCHHVAELSGGGDGGACGVPADYAAAFAAIHRRRMNWIPVLQMQKYFTIAEVGLELGKAAQAARRREKTVEESANAEEERREKMAEKSGGEEGDIVSKCHGNGECGSEGEDSPDSEITDTGSHEVQVPLDHIGICDNHQDCSARREQIKMTKGFVAKEPVKGHMVNVVKGLKVYDDIFTDSEISKLNDFVDKLRAAGQNGELLGETYILFNKQMKGNKREQIQLGVPIFEQMKDEAMSLGQKSNIEDIPALLQSVIDHLVQWHILPENRKPNGCIINYFDEGEYSQPYLKPPHVDQPICMLALSESTMAFGRTLVNDGDGNFRGKLMLSLKEGSVLVMRNNSADRAKHAMCSLPTRRVTITFSRVRSINTSLHHQNSSFTSLLAQPPIMTPALWQQPCAGFPSPPTIPIPMNQAPPLLMLVPPHPHPHPHPGHLVANPTRIMSHCDHQAAAGTGVFLPWAVGSRKPTTKHLPPRCQKGRCFLALPPIELSRSDTMSDPGAGAI